MLPTLVLKILYLVCKLCPDSSLEPKPVGVGTLFVITAVILKVVRIFLLHWVDFHFTFKKPKFYSWVQVVVPSCGRRRLGAVTGLEAMSREATLLRASLPPHLPQRKGS